MPEPSNPELTVKATMFLQRPREAHLASTLVIEVLAEIDGYAAIPHDVQTAIERSAALLYGAGFTRGVKLAKEVERWPSNQSP